MIVVSPPPVKRHKFADFAWPERARTVSAPPAPPPRPPIDPTLVRVALNIIRRMI